MKTHYFFIKRLLDVLVSLLGLVILSPLLIGIAIWIKIDSLGPIFFRQLRVGLHGKTFYIHKFRSMAINSEQQSQLTIGSDSRITRSGKFIRKYKIDELAQLIDVLQGTMSLVGPRPEVPKFMNIYPQKIRKQILSVKPGITDLASIEMIDESCILAKYSDPQQAYIDVIMPIKSEYYIKYIQKRSILFDIKVIFMTIFKILKKIK
ncbi:sugar transferase [Arsenophonus sp. PmNCSU2021_1]|uniref:sugar transferase n=1 Tax=Arsenophonus sp. PmNCSU2021_1 TaxID=3118989 RepID=UPI002FF2D7E2